MQSSYRVNLIECARHPTSDPTSCPINHQTPTQLSNVFPMTRNSPRQQSTRIAPVATASQSIAMQDWDTLFTAVKARLTLLAQPVSAPGQQPPPLDAANVERLCAAVLECVTALDSLHNTARDALTRQERISTGQM